MDLTFGPAITPLPAPSLKQTRIQSAAAFFFAQSAESKTKRLSLVPLDWLTRYWPNLEHSLGFEPFDLCRRKN
jgi:hypothetical protein